MKLPSISSPWTIVKWGSVLLIYGLTVGISLDQIRGRDATILSQKARVIKLESTIPQVTRNLNKIQAEISADKQVYAEEKARLENRLKLEESIQEVSKLAAKIQQAQPEEAPKESVSLQENAKRQMAERKAILETMQAGQSAAPSYVQSASSPVPNPSIPSWIPPSQSASVKIIKDRALAEWKDNYSMVNHSIQRDTEAFQKLLQYNKNPNSVVKTQIAKAAQEWPNSYSMMLYSVERQLEAKQKLDGR